MVVGRGRRRYVEHRPHEASDDLERGVALCLSGGGYRAMLFHAGALWRLNELGLLGTLARVSSVSGGAITGGMLGHAWPRLDFDERGVARALERELVAPLRRLARATIDLWSGLLGLIPGVTAAGRLAAVYRRRLFGDASLADLPGPGAPLFVLNAASLQTGALFQMSRACIADHRIGESAATAQVSLASAVAASSAFPPMLSPAIVRVPPDSWRPTPGADLCRDAYRSRSVLTDGGIYDNLGLATAYHRYATLLVSDAGAALPVLASPARNWLGQGLRVTELLLEDTIDTRKQELIAAYDARVRDGAYWSVRSDVADFARKCPGLVALPFDPDAARALAATPTRFKALPDETQEQLIDWGYVICDAAIRGHYLEGSRASPPARTPYGTSVLRCAR